MLAVSFRQDDATLAQIRKALHMISQGKQHTNEDTGLRLVG
jgi:hypothetical protein